MQKWHRSRPFLDLHQLHHLHHLHHLHQLHQLHYVIGALLVYVLLTGCAPEPSFNGATQTPVVIIITATPNPDGTDNSIPPPAVTRRQLPPTWTPTVSPTPRPTLTPFPTSTPFPTFTVEQLCADFAVLQPIDGANVPFLGRFSFLWARVPLASTMTVRINLLGAQAGLQLDAPFDGNGSIAVPLRLLPAEGRYEWQAWVNHPGYGRICDRKGTFNRAAPDWF